MAPSSDASDSLKKRPAASRPVAWAVHTLTASGVVIGLLALLAVIDGNPRAALLWLGLAMLVDGLDGPAARYWRVREALPRIDGSQLDLVVDYFTYCVVPALFIYRFELLPDAVAIVGAAFILVTSLYTFANLDMKTADSYFVGFPGVWNVVAFYMFILAMPPVVNLIATATFGVLTFVPIKFIHPLRVKVLRPATLAATGAWALASLGLVLMHPVAPPWILGLWLLASIYLCAVSAWRTIRGPT